MFPYLEQPRWVVGGHTIHAFQVLIATAIVVGFQVASRRGSRLGIDRVELGRALAVVILCGLVGSHWAAIFLYNPERLAQGWDVLPRLWDGMSSWGGILGGLLGAIVYERGRGRSAGETLALLDVVAYAFPFAWLLGRLGCALAHDHVGVFSDHWLTVKFPNGNRFDLGLLELFYTLPIAGAFVLLGRRERRPGFYLGLFIVLSAPVRFGLDFLRIGDARYAGLTPAQWACAALPLGVWLLWHSWRPVARSVLPHPASD